jgi:tetratricopeptide (TPR) repeat protein
LKRSTIIGGLAILGTVASFLLVDSRIRSNQLCRGYISLSKAFLEKGNPAGARDAAKASLRMGPTPAAYYQLGRIEEAEGDTVEASVRYEEASRLDPGFIEPLGALADLYEKWKDWERALAMRGRIIEIVPYRFEAHYNMGLTCSEAGRTTEAVAHLEKAVALASDVPDSWEVLGNLYREAGRPEDTLKAFQKAIELDPGRRPLLEKTIREMKREREDAEPRDKEN